ncbi:glyoxalase superfamily protein [Maritalea sp.]|uniref:glyoxalase superfamily protein n=1 Tax=Maritalea sp. TaxID=2003361 RepID=UPI003EF94CC0
MYTEEQIKGYAKALRNALSSRNSEFSHSDCLEIIAETVGEKSWNHLSANLRKTPNECRNNQIPDGWSFIGRDHLECYNARLEGEAHAKEMVIDCIEARANTFASLMQFISAKTYLGSHIRMAAEVATRNAGPTSLWMRVDGKPNSTLAFDNMVDVAPYRALEGTNEWTPLELVLDVPDGADIVNFGCMLSGSGMARFRNIKFEKVDNSVPVSGGRKYGGDEPTNLGLN